MKSNIHLTPIEATPRYQGNLSNDTWINVIRSPHKEIIAYFVRNYKGTLLFINSNLDIPTQARAIKMIKNELVKCPISNMGLINKDWEYKCNGICCK